MFLPKTSRGIIYPKNTNLLKRHYPTHERIGLSYNKIGNEKNNLFFRQSGKKIFRFLVVLIFCIGDGKKCAGINENNFTFHHRKYTYHALCH